MLAWAFASTQAGDHTWIAVGESFSQVGVRMQVVAFDIQVVVMEVAAYSPLASCSDPPIAAEKEELACYTLIDEGSCTQAVEWGKAPHAAHFWVDIVSQR